MSASSDKGQRLFCDEIYQDMSAIFTMDNLIIDNNNQQNTITQKKCLLIFEHLSSPSLEFLNCVNLTLLYIV